MSFLSKLKNQRGFTLVEVAIVTAITTLALGTGLWTKIQEAHVKKGEVLGEQLHRISAGVDDYLNKNYSALVQFTPNVSGFADPLHPTITELKAKNYLPGGISNSNIYGGGYKVFITKTPSGCVPSTCNLSVLTMISSPVLQQSSGALDTVALGSASKAIGGDAAVSHTAATLDGTGGTWSESNPLGQAGIVAVRSGYGVSSMNEFYRRNGSMPLTGDLSGGGQNINNVNQVDSQSINNAGDVATNTVTATGDVTGAKFIDKNDPGYYVDPNGTSRTGRINADNLYSYGWLYGTKFYDTNNPNYYVDPNGVSKVNHIELNDAVVKTVVVEGTPCTPNGMVARSSTGLLLSCQSGKWSQATGSGGGGGFTGSGVNAFLAPLKGMKAETLLPCPNRPNSYNRVFCANIQAMVDLNGIGWMKWQRREAASRWNAGTPWTAWTSWKKVVPAGSNNASGNQFNHNSQGWAVYEYIRPLVFAVAKQWTKVSPGYIDIYGLHNTIGTYPFGSWHY